MSYLLQPTSQVRDRSSIKSDLVLGVVDFRPLQTLTTAPFDVGNTGDRSPISVANESGFVVGDVVQLTERGDDETTSKVAYLLILGTSPLEVGVLDRSEFSFVAKQGDRFTAGSELTGQTRLPSAPAGSAYAHLFCMQSQETVFARHNPSDPASSVAKTASAEFPLCSFTFKVDAQDIDGLTTMGIPLMETGSVEIANENFEVFRLFSKMPYRFRPFIKAVFR